MELYLAADSGRLQQAMACTAQLAHMSYRIGPDGTLLASPLPDTLRGGLLMLSDEGGSYPDAPEGLCRQLVQECLRRRYAGVVLMPCRRRASAGHWMSCWPDRSGSCICRRLQQAMPPTARRSSAPPLPPADLEDRLAAAAEKWGPERLALDLQRMMLDYPLSAGGEAAALTPSRLHALAEGRATYFSRPLCARYFTYRTDSGSRFVLFDDVQTLRMKMDMAEKLGIRQDFSCSRR